MQLKIPGKIPEILKTRELQYNKKSKTKKPKHIQKSPARCQKSINHNKDIKA
jgi:hypothetical protein